MSSSSSSSARNFNEKEDTSDRIKEPRGERKSRWDDNRSQRFQSVSENTKSDDNGRSHYSSKRQHRDENTSRSHYETENANVSKITDTKTAATTLIDRYAPHPDRSHRFQPSVQHRGDESEKSDRTYRSRNFNKEYHGDSSSSDIRSGNERDLEIERSHQSHEFHRDKRSEPSHERGRGRGRGRGRDRDHDHEDENEHTNRNLGGSGNGNGDGDGDCGDRDAPSYGHTQTQSQGRRYYEQRDRDNRRGDEGYNRRGGGGIVSDQSRGRGWRGGGSGDPGWFRGGARGGFRGGSSNSRGFGGGFQEVRGRGRGRGQGQGQGQRGHGDTPGFVFGRGIGRGYGRGHVQYDGQNQADESSCGGGGGGGGTTTGRPVNFWRVMQLEFDTYNNSVEVDGFHYSNLYGAANHDDTVQEALAVRFETRGKIDAVDLPHSFSSSSSSSLMSTTSSTPTPTNTNTNTNTNTTETRENMKQEEEDHTRKVCPHWMRQMCTSGVECPNIHAYRTNRIPLCEFKKFNVCTRPDCEFSHDRRVRMDKEHACYAYSRVLFCPAGSKCKDVHVPVTLCPAYNTGYCANGPLCSLAQYVSFFFVVVVVVVVVISFFFFLYFFFLVFNFFFL